MDSPAFSHKKITTYLLSLLGAIGIALQNYIGMSLFLQGIISGIVSISRGLGILLETLSIAFGGVCSGLINLFINVELLHDFFKRLTGEKKLPQLSLWQKVRLYGVSVIFVATGILFGLTAFTFGMTSPLAVLAIISGFLVAGITIIQELETWISSFEEAPQKQTNLRLIVQHWWETLTAKKAIGHLIAAGNVIALSLLFTLGLTEIFLLAGIATLPAFIIALSIAFTVGAFTEFYFYNAFIAEFCEKINHKWQEMKQTQYAAFGMLIVTINAVVNGALTYSGVALLTGYLAAAGLAIPPLGVLIFLYSTCAIFAAVASGTLGSAFWIRMMSPPSAIENPKPAKHPFALSADGQSKASAPPQEMTFYSSILSSSSNPDEVNSTFPPPQKEMFNDGYEATSRTGCN